MIGSTSASAKRILVIDDHQDIRAFMRAALEEAGYEVSTAPEGARALERMRERPADLVVTDIFMPGLEGFETISRCKAEFPQARLIVMSAGTIPGMQHDFLETTKFLGVAATLRKPFSAEELVEAVREVLRDR